jgi:hypothetical protein
VRRWPGRLACRVLGHPSRSLYTQYTGNVRKLRCGRCYQDVKTEIDPST